jgi:protein required for attachment to host cells
MKRIRTWVVIANSAHARFLLNDGQGHGLVELRDLDLKQDHLATQELVTDRPGRSFNSNGSGKHAVDTASDQKRLEEKKFAGKVVALLATKFRENSFDRLILVSGPTMLGDIREKLLNDVSGCIVTEVPKNLNHYSNEDLTNYMGKFLAV